VPTVEIGNAFFNHYKTFNNKDSLNVCKSVCEFFINDMEKKEFPDDTICFSHHLPSNICIHNSNLFASEFLIKTGLETRQKQYVEMGENAIEHTLSEQNEDGSFFYWSKSDEHFKPHIDHYHTCFELRNLYSIKESTSKKEHIDAFERLYRFYRKEMFNENDLPKISPKRTYPLNILSFSESIFTFSKITDRYSENKDFIEKLVHKVGDIMQTKNGWYVYQIHNLGGIRWKAEIPYMRQGQSSMLRALSEYSIRNLEDE
jgi:hypothetical protein